MVQDIIATMFLIFTGASIMATLALYTRQTILVAYIFVGMLIGPNGLSLITDSALIGEISDIGIIFLLFLLGLNLHPQSLFKTLEKTAIITLTSSTIFAITGFIIAVLFNFDFFEASIIGACMMFSSTILGLKLLPTTVLHHKKMGQIVISILLLQDLIAIALLLLFNVSVTSDSFLMIVLRFILELPGLIAIAFILERFVVNKLFAKFDQTKEYIFLLAIGWCLGIAELAHAFGLSHEIGAFIAGITIARTSISFFISENLKPLRDFFLVLFFFALGASFAFRDLTTVLIPAVVIVGVLMLIKPFVFGFLLSKIRDHELVDLSKQKAFTKEIGARLGQLSEFSLLLIYVAETSFQISQRVTSLVITTTIISFIISSYWIIINYPTPLAVDEHLRLD